MVPLTTRFDFSGKVAVITGAAGGIGQALLQRFGRAGAALALVDCVPMQHDLLTDPDTPTSAIVDRGSATMTLPFFQRKLP